MIELCECTSSGLTVRESQNDSWITFNFLSYAKSSEGCSIWLQLHRITNMLGLSKKAQLGLGAIWLFAGTLIGLLWLLNRPAIEITWQTETELDSIGFNILRSEDEQGPYIKKNEKLIPASEDAVAGADYSYVDKGVISGQVYYYQLEDVDVAGSATTHTSISFQAPEKPLWMLGFGLVAIVVGLLFLYSGQKDTTR
jgi:hypothetical protein